MNDSHTTGFRRRGLRRLLVCLSAMVLTAAMIAPSAGAVVPDQARGAPVTNQGELERLAQRVRELIKVVEDADMACETRNDVVEKLRVLNDAFESGRPSAARALLIAWMNHARTSAGAGLLSAEQATALHTRMDEVLAQVPIGYAAEPRPTRHWKALPSCDTPPEPEIGPQLAESGVALAAATAGDGTTAQSSYTPEIADFDSNDALIFITSILGAVPYVGSLLAGLAALLWPAAEQPDINDLINSAIEDEVEGQLVTFLNDLGTRVNNFNGAIDDWRTDCPTWADISTWSADPDCATGAYALAARYMSTYDDITGYRAHFQWATPVDYRVMLLPLFAQYENVLLGYLRDGILLQPYFVAGGYPESTTQTARKAMTIELDPTPTIAEYGSWGPEFQNFNVGMNYVNAIYEKGLNEKPAADSDANWNTRNSYLRDMAAYVLDFRDTWKYIDPDAYPQGAPAGITLDRMIYSDLIGGVTNWDGFKQPENVTGPLTELTFWAEQTFDLNWYSTLVPEALQATSPPTAGPARSGPITGDASFNHRDELDPTSVYFFDLRTRGPVVKVTTTRDQGMSIFYPDWFPSSVSLTFARGGSAVKIGNGTHDVKDWAYPGYVLATAAIEGTWNHTGNRSEAIADSIVFGFRRADSYSPSGAAVSLQSGKCLDASAAVSGTQTRIWPCHAGPNQVWTYDIGTKELTTYDNLEMTDPAKPSTRIKLCLTASGTTRGSAVTISNCTAGGNQQWDLVASADGQHGLIKSVQSGLVLDVTSGGTANGTPIILWTQVGGPNQLWNLPSPLQGQERNVATGRCLDVSDSAFPNGATVYQWRCHQPGDTLVNQLWTYDAVSKALKVGGQAKCLKATGNTVGSGVVIWDCTEGLDQQWTLNDDRTITNVLSGLALEVVNSSTADGGAVKLAARNQSLLNQLWTRPAEQGGQLYHLGAGKCLDLPFFAPTTQALIENCLNVLTQKWTYHPLVQKFTVYSSTGTGGATFCLGADPTGTQAVINPCGADPTQRWALVRVSGGVTGTIRNVASGLCLSLPGTTRVTARLTKVGLETCRAADDPLKVNQQWVLSR